MIGGGIAGCAEAGGLKTLGIEAIILDAAAQEGAGASGNLPASSSVFDSWRYGWHAPVHLLSSRYTCLSTHDLI